MYKNDMVSVIIPTYNREKIIEKSIKSVLNQTYNNIEVIIIDDGSTDNTEKVIKNIKDTRIRYIKLKKNQGACNARNVGIKKANGKYIAFQDSDDIFYNDKIEKQLNNLLKNKSDLDFCKICIKSNGYNSIVPNIKQEQEIKNNNILDELCNGNFISTQAILVKTKCIKKHLFDKNIPRWQDFDLLLRLLPNIKVSYTNELLVDLYRQSDSISSSNEKLKKAIMILLKKQYKLNDFQRDKLNNWLIINNPDYTTLNEKYYLLLNENKELNEAYIKLLESYNNILNSKRWKLINKIAKIIKK